jgi:N-acetylglucosaminyldiphosphoundecaprenol N-acetyl-beta-D-mannosaminyltransferase
MPSDTTRPPDDFPAPAEIGCLGTPLTVTDHPGALALCRNLAARPTPAAIEFCNTQIVTLRRSDADYRRTSECFDRFIPDSSPLLWLLNAAGAGMKDRVYGPAFFRHALTHSPGTATHYLLGGSEACGRALAERFTAVNPGLRIVGSFHGRCDVQGFLGADDAPVLEELQRLKPDFIWVGLGTPKQQRWIARVKPLLERGVLLSVGQAFDVNAGLRADAPDWMQRCGLTWLYRMASEPRRLVGRYLHHNTLFLAYLLWDALRGRVFQGSTPH